MRAVPIAIGLRQKQKAKRQKERAAEAALSRSNPEGVGIRSIPKDQNETLVLNRAPEPLMVDSAPAAFRLVPVTTP
jgi:hypothetical protein